MTSSFPKRNSEVIAWRLTQYARGHGNLGADDGLARTSGIAATPGRELSVTTNRDSFAREHADEPSLPAKKQSWREWFQGKKLRNDIVSDVVISSQLASEQQEAIRALLWDRHETSAQRELALWTADPSAMSGFVTALRRALDQGYCDSSRLQGVCRKLMEVLLGEASTPQAAKSILKRLYRLNHSDKNGRLKWGSNYAAEQFQVFFEALKL